jgi:hypothetical protein
MSCFVATALRRLRRPRLRHGATLTTRTRLLHVVHTDPVLRAGTECTRPTAFAERPLLTRDDAVYWPRLGHRAGVTPKPGVRSPARVAFGGTSYARTTLAVVPHLSVIGRRRTTSDLRLPALYRGADASGIVADFRRRLSRKG